jgi:hypothetical protein
MPNISSYRDFLSLGYNIEPGAICHIGVVGFHIRDDVQFMIADESGVWFRFPERGYDRDSEQLPWGDLIEFWPYPTSWIFREEAGATSTVDKYKVYSSRFKAVHAVFKRCKEFYKAEGESEAIEMMEKRLGEFESGRRCVFRFGRFLLFPARLDMEA